MSRAGIGIGIGEGLEEIAKSIRERRMLKEYHRDKEADRLEKQLQQIAANKVQLKQELAMTPQGTPDYVSKAGELQNADDMLAKATQNYHALGAEDQGWLIGRIKGLFGSKPQAPAPFSGGGDKYKTGITQTPELLSAASPLPDIKESDAYKRHQGGLNTELSIADLKAKAPVQRQIGLEDATAAADFQQALKEKTSAATIEWAQKHGLSEELLGDLNATLAGIPAALLAREKIGPKPVEPVISDKMLIGIKDPNTGASYHAGNIDKAPPEVKAQWDAISKQQADERARDEAAQEAKNAEAEKRQSRQFAQQLNVQTQAFQNALDSKDYADARKTVSEADKDYQGAIDRQKTMAKNVVDASKGDQQAMLSLVSNHIGMTLGGQKGARINQAVWNEAIASAPWLSTIAAKWSGDGYLSGVTLTPDQMKSMLNLANEKVEVLKEHKQRLDTQYADVLKLNKGTPGDLKDKAKAGGVVKDPLGILK